MAGFSFWYLIAGCCHVFHYPLCHMHTYVWNYAGASRKVPTSFRHFVNTSEASSSVVMTTVVLFLPGMYVPPCDATDWLKSPIDVTVRDQDIL